MSTDSQPRSGRQRARRSSREVRPASTVSGAESGTGATRAVPAQLPVRRSPKWVALGIVAICLGGLLSYVVYARVATEQQVATMAETVYRGEVIEAKDLTRITLSGNPTIPVVPADEAAALVGKHAAVDLLKGTVVAPEAVTSRPRPVAGRSVVGIRLSDGRAPARLMVPGAPIRLIGLPAANAEPKAWDPNKGRAFMAQLVSAEPGTDAGAMLIEVDVASADAADLAMLAAQDRLAVIREAK